MKWKASNKVITTLGEERIEKFLEHFNKNKPWDTINFIPEIIIMLGGNEVEEMYSCSYDKYTVLVFPMIDKEGEKFVFLTFEEECPLEINLDH